MKSLEWLGTAYHWGLRLDRALSASCKLQHPVLSVGNLSVGGRGKTPFAILISQWIQKQGFQPVVLTRGYGRKSSEPVWLLSTNSPLASENRPATLPKTLQRPAQENHQADWGALAGDEALEIWASADVDVLVGSDRAQNGSLYEKQFSLNKKQPLVFVLDDGFQHWNLARDYDLVLLDPLDERDRLLPIGRLREPLSALSRATRVMMRGRDFNKQTQLTVAPPPSERAGVLTTRAPDSAYMASILACAPNATELISLADHAPYKHMVSAVQGPQRPSHLIVGVKEAAKILEPSQLLEALRTGTAEWTAGKKKIHLYLAHCHLDILNPSFWLELEAWLRKFQD